MTWAQPQPLVQETLQALNQVIAANRARTGPGPAAAPAEETIAEKPGETLAATMMQEKFCDVEN